MPLSLGSDGWTTWTQASGANTIYVAANGNDSNAGTIGSPKLTVSSAYNSLRDGFPDRIAVRYGDTFSANISWRKSGASAAEPMGMLAYTDGTPGHQATDALPVLNGGGSNVFDNTTWYSGGGGGSALVPMNNLAWFDLNINGGGGAGWNTVTRGSNWLIEGCLVTSCSSGMATVNNVLTGGCGTPAGAYTHQNCNINNGRVRRTHFYRNNEFGVYMGGHEGTWVFEDSSFMENAFFPTIFVHQFYFDDSRGTRTAITINNGMFAGGKSRRGSHGIQIRPGGTAVDCMAVRLPIAFQLGSGGCEQGTDLDPRAPLDGLLDRCGVLDGIDGDNTGGTDLPRGWAFEFMGISNGTVRKCFAKDSEGHYRFALYFEKRGTGTQNLTVEDCKFRDFGKVYFEGTQSELRNFRFRNNDLQFSSANTSNPVLEHEQGTINNLTFAEFTGNRIYHPSSSSTTSAGTVAQYQSAVGGSGNTATQVTYSAPTRGVRSYLTSLGIATASDDAAYDEWVQRVRTNRRSNWNDAYTAKALYAHVAAGLDMTTPTPPTTPAPGYYRRVVLGQ